MMMQAEIRNNASDNYNEQPYQNMSLEDLNMLAESNSQELQPAAMQDTIMIDVSKTEII